MKLKFMMFDISQVPDGWEIDKWLKYMDMMKLPVNGTDKHIKCEIDVTFWQWLKFKMGVPINWTKKLK